MFTRLPALCRSIVALTAMCFAVLSASSCSSGSGGNPAAPSAPVAAAAITVQPANQSVPMGIPATFTVTAVGSSLNYQWERNGVAITGATGSTYTIPATAFADNGAAFSVTVTNSAGAVTSTTASLTVTARAPMTGDLRFQQVDAASTVNGWGNAGVGLSTFLVSRGGNDFVPSIGTQFFLESGNCVVPPVTDGTGCEWAFAATPMNVSASSPAVLAGYGSDTWDNLQADLQNPSWPGFSNSGSPASASSVITSMDLEPASILFAVSWIESSVQTGFTPVQNTVAPADLEAAANLEGASARVITAVSNNAGSITYIAYGWQADTSSIYEAHVVTASAANTASAAASLAAQGYIITATGLADSNGNIILVGTRVQGDTMARPFVAVHGSMLQQGLQLLGYANVGVLVDPTSPTDEYIYLGER